MKKHNRIIAGILAVCLMGGIGIIPESIIPTVSMTASAETMSGTCGENVTWSLSYGTLTIKGSGAMEDFIFSPPWASEYEYGDYRDYIETVSIEKEVTHIGRAAFKDCKNLKTVMIADSVKSIGQEAFRGCESLTEIRFSSYLTNIGMSAFQDCKSLTKVLIPYSITEIGASAFNNCENLTEVLIPNNINATSIAGTAFYYTPWFEEKKKENPLVIVNGFLMYAQSCSGDVVIPDGVKSICSSAFYKCTDLTSVKIPDSVKSIDYGAFMECTGLTEITIPKNVTTIGNSVFYKCENLTTIKLPDGLKEIGERAFLWCKNLTEITLPDSVTSIGQDALSGTGLKEIVIPDRVTILSQGVLGSCPNLAKVTIPDGVKKLNYAVFVLADLTEVTIPESVEFMDERAVGLCKNLNKVTILNPECEFYKDKGSIISNGYDSETKEYYFNGTIYGYSNSTAQTYAEINNYKFVALDGENTPTGDANGDNEFNISDVVTFQQYILGGSDKEISDWKQADLNSDGILDVFDLCLMKKKLIEK